MSSTAKQKVDWMGCEHAGVDLTEWVGCTRHGGQCEKCMKSKFGPMYWCKGCNFVTYRTEINNKTLKFKW